MFGLLFIGYGEIAENGGNEDQANQEYSGYTDKGD